MKPWLYCFGAIAVAAALIGAYFYGRADGAAVEIAKQAAVEHAVEVERGKREVKVDQVGAGAAVRETQRATNVRELVRETQTVVERPVYRNICVDADGVRLLDAAAATANGEDRGDGSAGTGAPPAGQPLP